MLHNLLVGWHNVECCSVITAARGGMYSVLPPCWEAYEHCYILTGSTLLLFSYYGGSFRRGDADDIQ